MSLLSVVYKVSRSERALDVKTLPETRQEAELRFNCMINPDDDFLDDEPLSAAPASNQDEIETTASRRLRRPAAPPSATTSDNWQQVKEKAATARERTELFLRENPVPTILGALGIGLAIGLAIRYASTAEEKEKTPIANINWGFLSLPFLWPFFKSVKDRYEDSTEALKDGVDRVRNIDVHRYTKPIRKRWKTWAH
jgi:ElaB/YqjD/DUF883 family membrane-anchored ribosome-binding protein